MIQLFHVKVLHHNIHCAFTHCSDTMYNLMAVGELQCGSGAGRLCWWHDKH